LVHDFADEAIDRSNSAFDFTAAENLCPMDIPSCQISPGAFAKVLVLDASGTIGSGWQGRLFPAASLNAGLFVGGDDVVVSAQRSAFPDAFVQIEDRTLLCRKSWDREGKSSFDVATAEVRRC
jgi:hypothetical protein